jgi:hypothetical protein
VRESLLYGIAWVGVGLALLAQAVFLALMGAWLESGAATPDRYPANVASAVVSLGFVVAGLGAVVLGARGINAARRDR